MAEKEVIAEVPGFFGTLTPYIIVAVLILAAYAMSFYREEKEEHSSLWKALAVAIPTCLGIAAVIEVLAFKFVGTDAIWWCDGDRYGFWMGVLLILPLFLFVVLQFLSLSAYNRFLFSGKYGNKHICIKPAAWALVLVVPVFFIIFCVCLAYGWKDDKAVMAMLGIPAVMLIIGLAISFYKNIKLFGLSAGLVMSAFCVVYVLGAIAAVGFCAIAIWKLIVQVLTGIGGVFLCVLGASKMGLFDGMDKQAKKEWDKYYKDPRNQIHY